MYNSKCGRLWCDGESEGEGELQGEFVIALSTCSGEYCREGRGSRRSTPQLPETKPKIKAKEEMRSPDLRAGVKGTSEGYNETRVRNQLSGTNDVIDQ